MGIPIKGTDLQAEDIYVAVQFQGAVEQYELAMLKERSAPELLAEIRARAVEKVLQSGRFVKSNLST